jgi:hypothetical protein
MYRMGTPRLHGQAAEGAQRLSLNGPIRVLAHQPRLPILFLKPYQNRGLSEIIWLQAWICSDRAQRIFGTASSSGSDRAPTDFRHSLSEWDWAGGPFSGQVRPRRRRF